jgi:hypothetical protein
MVKALRSGDSGKMQQGLRQRATVHEIFSSCRSSLTGRAENLQGGNIHFDVIAEFNDDGCRFGKTAADLLNEIGYCFNGQTIAAADDPLVVPVAVQGILYLIHKFAGTFGRCHVVSLSFGGYLK